MIIIKKKVLFIFFLIIFFINIFLISKRRDFNFSNLMNSFYLSEYLEIKEDLNVTNKKNNYNDYNNLFIFLKKNKIKEVNFDIDIPKKEDLIYYIYPIKFNDKSQYVIGYFNQRKYNGCKLIISKPKNIDENFLKKKVTLYICE